EFSSHEITWAIHRQIYKHRIDVLQLEYTPLAQYAEQFKQIPSILFEHDVYFQSIGRQLPNMAFSQKVKAGFEYMRALRYELGVLPKVDRIQVCSRDNRDYLLSFLPALSDRVDDDLRAGIDTARYPLVLEGREANTLLFLGGFRHLPNQEALAWFVKDILPLILREQPAATLKVVGADPPPRHAFPKLPDAVELVGFVEDVIEPLTRYSVFICPILSGSGIRVKLLEAFAAGIPVVSTRIGAEGFGTGEEEICALADTAEEFARAVLDLLASPQKARGMATRARQHLERTRDMRTITATLEQSYRAAVSAKRPAFGDPSSHPSADLQIARQSG
ncbi:MAG TPA: glycosyltransferase family 4 protein, partial [Bryobacteraceae bacterium]|nr:glycosyltransferase family 4 protein [Bryobacteraceae bacterium]